MTFHYIDHWWPRPRWYVVALGHNELTHCDLSHPYHHLIIWVRSRNCGCLVTWFCYQLIAKPGNKTAAVSWPDPYKHIYIYIFVCVGACVRACVCFFHPPYWGFLQCPKGLCDYPIQTTLSCDGWRSSVAVFKTLILCIVWNHYGVMMSHVIVYLSQHWLW